MSIEKPPTSPRCCDCGAENDAGASECWLCHRRDWRSGAPPVPGKIAATPDGGLSRRSIAGAIVGGTILIVGVGMVLDLVQNLQLYVYLGLLILWLPVVFLIVSRVRRPPVPGPRMTTLEFTTAATTIAAGAIVLMWLVRTAGGSFAFTVFGIFSLPAALYTLQQARSRRYQGRPMTGLQLTASMLFGAVLAPGLVATSLFIALYLICLASGPLTFH